MTDRPRPQLAVGAFVFDGEERLLMVRRARPPGVDLWTIPGGRVEFGEPLRRACVREAREETGLDIEIVDFVTVFERLDPEFHYVIIDFCARPLDSAAVPKAGDDAGAARWVSVSAMADLPLTDGLLPVVPQALAIFRAGAGVRR